jgi:predicted MFS family arabinose efflux permease
MAGPGVNRTTDSRRNWHLPVLHSAHTVVHMSTVTDLESGRETCSAAPRERLVSGPLAWVFLSSFAALTSFYLMLSVTPMCAAAAGAGSAGAGLVTGVLLLGTVAAELASSALMKRFRYRTLLIAGAALMGLPALALLAGSPLPVIAAVSAVRGFGFGLGTVVMATLTALLLPPQRRGEGLGLYGVVDSLPGVVALPAGVWLAGRYGYAVVVLLTAATALVPVAVFRWLPGRAEPRTTNVPAEPGLLTGLRQRGALRLALIFGATTVAGGVVVSFLPLATGVAAIGLFVQALTATIGRWWAGRRGDRHGHAGLLVPGLAIAAAGMIAMIGLRSPAAMLAGMGLFGTGFGIIQNATLVLMIDRMAASGPGPASALWNLAYDAGYGAGPAVFGLFAGHTGYPAAFALTGLLMLAALPAGRRAHAAGGP